MLQFVSSRNKWICAYLNCFAYRFCLLFYRKFFGKLTKWAMFHTYYYYCSIFWWFLSFGLKLFNLQYKLHVATLLHCHQVKTILMAPALPFSHFLNFFSGTNVIFYLRTTCYSYWGIQLQVFGIFIRKSKMLLNFI